MSFKSLVSVVSEQRQEIKQALTLFPYFETWEPDLVSECCRVSSVVEFPPDEIILGPDTGNSHAVYFILDGICKMLRDLFVVVKRGSYSKKALYKLSKIPSRALNSESKNEGYASRLFNKNYSLQKETKGCGKENESNLEILSFRTEAPTDNAVAETNNENPSDAKTGDEIPSKEKNSEPTENLQPESLVEEKTEQIQPKGPSETKIQNVYQEDDHLKVLEECKKRRENMIRVFKKTPPPEKPKNTKCFFLQIGFLLKGACFGLEKSEKEIYIMSMTTVKCLRIPRRFLLQHNPCNIWNRIRLFQSLHLPKEEKLFEYFKSDRMWMERKKSQTSEIISLKNLPRYTTLNEVPYSIRLTNPM